MLLVAGTVPILQWVTRHSLLKQIVLNLCRVSDIENATVNTEGGWGGDTMMGEWVRGGAMAGLGREMDGRMGHR